MKRQKKSTTTTDIFYLECLINKLIRTSTTFQVHSVQKKQKTETPCNIQQKLTVHKLLTQPLDNKIQASQIYQQKVLHAHLRPQSEGQSRRLQIDDQPPQKNIILRQIRNQMMLTRQQLWTRVNCNQQDTKNPLTISRKPIKTISFNIKSSFKNASNTSRPNTNLNLSNLRSSPMKTMTERQPGHLTGWQTSEDDEWV